jgi:hypothetical protein
MSKKCNVIKLCTSIYMLVYFCKECNGNLNADRLPTKRNTSTWFPNLKTKPNFGETLSFVSKLNGSYDFYYLSLNVTSEPNHV